MSDKIIKPDYIFETSWEICNMVGGIYTVLSTKARTIVEDYGDNYILIGPDVWMETSEHPDFIEDPEILASWREKASAEGLNIRIGRWNISGFPLVILVDFKPLFGEKDKIFFDLWEQFKLDSLSGQWDYIEPAMFGYAAAKVIESFYEFNLSATDKIVAQFHEWMTGTGALYLKQHVPQVGTVFTSHATVLGRSVAGNGSAASPVPSGSSARRAVVAARPFSSTVVSSEPASGERLRVTPASSLMVNVAVFESPSLSVSV